MIPPSAGTFPVKKIPDTLTHSIRAFGGWLTSDKIAVEYLKQEVKNSDAWPDADWKLMLMDNHGSHMTPEFVALANQNYIRPYSMIAHLTHYMQPLDVGVFQPYKHWHDVAIQRAVSESFIEYSLTDFLRLITRAPKYLCLIIYIFWKEFGGDEICKSCLRRSSQEGSSETFSPSWWFGLISSHPMDSRIAYLVLSASTMCKTTS